MANECLKPHVNTHRIRLLSSIRRKLAGCALENFLWLIFKCHFTYDKKADQSRYVLSNMLLLLIVKVKLFHCKYFKIHKNKGKSVISPLPRDNHFTVSPKYVCVHMIVFKQNLICIIYNTNM